MKIVYATRAAIPYPSAASLNTVQMCQCLAQMGHEVTLAVGRKFWRRRTLVGDWSKYYGFKPQFTVRRSWELPRTAWWFDRQVTRYAAQTSSLLYARYPRILPSATRADLTVMLELHSSVTQRERRGISEALRSGHLHTIVVITSALRDHLLSFPELQGFAERFHVAPDAVDCARFPHWQTTGNINQIGYIGSLFPGKGMEIIAQLAQLLPETRFDVFGGRREELSQWQSTANRLTNLRLHGYLAPAKIPTQMNSFTIALLPNQPTVRLPTGEDIGRFTSPMKLFEYMAAGRAIIASDLPGLREVLNHEQNCLLVPHDDLSAWCHAIDRLQQDESLRIRLIRNARQQAEREYSFSCRFQRILQRLETAVPNQTGSLYPPSEISHRWGAPASHSFAS